MLYGSLTSVGNESPISDIGNGSSISIGNGSLRRNLGNESPISNIDNESLSR